jgi:hypothetical protein
LNKDGVRFGIINSPIPESLKGDIEEPHLFGQFLKLLDTTISHTKEAKLIARTHQQDRVYCVVTGKAHLSLVSPYESLFIYPVLGVTPK